MHSQDRKKQANTYLKYYYCGKCTQTNQSKKQTKHLKSHTYKIKKLTT